MGSVFLEKYTFITAVDVIQQKKLDFRNFYEFNVTKAKLETIKFSTVLLE